MRSRAAARPCMVSSSILIVEREHAPRIIDHRLALGGERHARRALVEQFDTEQHLQALDLRTHGRLSHAERLRRPGEATQVDHGDQRAQQIGRYVRHSHVPVAMIVRARRSPGS